MGVAETVYELASITSGTGQHLTDQIANSDRNGCFEYCDGWPESLRQEFGSIMLASAEIIRAGEESDEDAEALLQRGRDYASKSAVLHAICKAECPGAYSLFDDDEALEDLKGEPFIKPCPVSVRLSTALEEAKQALNPAE